MNATLLTLGQPNKNHRIYHPDIVKKAIEEYLEKSKGRPPVVHAKVQMTATQSIENIVGTVENIQVTDAELIGDVKVFPGKEPLLGLSCRPSFIGSFEEDGKTVKELQLISFFFTADPA